MSYVVLGIGELDSIICRLSYTGNLRAVYQEPKGGATNLHQPQQDHRSGYFFPKPKRDNPTTLSSKRKKKKMQQFSELKEFWVEWSNKKRIL